MKLQKFLLLGGMVAMLLFGAASCQDKNSGIDPDTLETGTTYMSLVLDLSQSIDELRLTRAEDDDVHNPAGEWEGRDLIKNGMSISCTLVEARYKFRQ